MMGMVRVAFAVLFLSCACSADNGLGESGIGGDYSGYKHFLTELIKEGKRSVITDQGYGSRLQAGTNVADAVTTYDKIYGAYGPGKRSVIDNDYGATANDAGAVLEDLPKRYYTDLGYGSRVNAGKNIADARWAKDGIFGSKGPGKRSVEDSGLLGFLRNLRSGAVGDAGYLSRIAAAKTLARDIDASSIYGHMGPGRRR